MHTDEIMRLAEQITRLASADHFDLDDLKPIWKAAKEIERVRGEELEAEDFAQEIAMPMSADAEDRYNETRAA
jgi:hypothetical protein